MFRCFLKSSLQHCTGLHPSGEMETFEERKKDGYCEEGLKREEAGEEWLKVLDIDGEELLKS